MTNHQQLRVSGKRLWQRLMDMAEIGPGQSGGSCRLALTDDDKAGRDQFIEWCQALNLNIRIDDMGNIFARHEGSNNNLAPVVAGSHLDTQPHGGRFDGIFGVLSALEAVQTLHENQIVTQAPLEIVVWTNEEGSRFAPAMIASGVYAGLFEKSFAWSRTDSNGLRLEDELDRIGYKGEMICGSNPFGALLEAHIEQGPILEAKQEQIGVVIGGQGQRWYDITIKGQDSHAGSTPMPGRRDALVAAANVIQLVQTLALDFSPHAVGTVGEMSVIPNSRNTIPGEVRLTVDLRNPDDKALASMDHELRQKANEIFSEHGVEAIIDQIWHNPPVIFNPECIDAVRVATEQLGYSHREMVSGAGHDACQVCRVVPTAMIFVPCEGGLSHNEAEYASPEDLEAGCNVLLHAMIKLAGLTQ
ncbi:MAG: N-carbamoyl-L-amino-acid hydrolase [Parasphingorhabdus sp.]|jgi:N-carbamoyl-L-amino-acid hydrolase